MEKEKISVYVNPDYVGDFKILCKDRGETMSRVMDQQIIRLVKEWRKKKEVK